MRFRPRNLVLRALSTALLACIHPLKRFQENVFKITQGEILEVTGRKATLMKRLKSFYRNLLDIISKITLTL